MQKCDEKGLDFPRKRTKNILKIELTSVKLLPPSSGGGGGGGSSAISGAGYGGG